MKRMCITVAGILTASLLLCGCGTVEGETAEQGGTENGETVQAESIRDESIAETPRPVENAENRQEETKENEEASQELEQLAGSSFSILGDSISTFQGYIPRGYYDFFPEYGKVEAVEDTWWRIAAEDLDLTLYVNGSSAGATVTGDSTGMEDPQCACNEFRTNDLAGPGGVSPDRIIVYLGTNDLLNSVRLEDNDDTGVVTVGEIDTFSDAYSLMLDKLLAYYPSARIYCCTLLQVGDHGTQTPYVEFVNGEGLTAADYSGVIVRIAGNKDLPVIDLYNCGVTVENLEEMTSDGVHPTAAGMRQIAAAVEKALAGE